MESLVSNSIEDLHLLNASLSALITRMRSTNSAEVTAESLSWLLSGLARGSAWVRACDAHAPADPQARTEVTHYQEHLNQIQQGLPEWQARLLAQRSRLEARRNHLRAATAWADGARQTATSESSKK
jgi:hypothetical protein